MYTVKGKKKNIYESQYGKKQGTMDLKAVWTIAHYLFCFCF